MNEIQKPIFLMLVALTWSCFATAELRYGRSCDAIYLLIFPSIDVWLR